MSSLEEAADAGPPLTGSAARQQTAVVAALIEGARRAFREGVPENLAAGWSPRPTSRPIPGAGHTDSRPAPGGHESGDLPLADGADRTGSDPLRVDAGSP
jgi:hypothetical protein